MRRSFEVKYEMNCMEREAHDEFMMKIEDIRMRQQVAEELFEKHLALDRQKRIQSSEKKIIITQPHLMSFHV
jgi:hypothetical protein